MTSSPEISPAELRTPLAWSVVVLLTAVGVCAWLASRADAAPFWIVASSALPMFFWWLWLRHFLTRQLEAPLLAARDAAQALARVEKLATTGRLAAGIAHEVGNPLAAIATYAQLVRQRSDTVPGTAEPLDGIDREVERIDRIVRGLLDYARPRRRTPRSVRVDDVLADVLRLLTDQGVLRRMHVTRDIHSGDASVFAERHDLEQVFVNLVLNARDAMGGVGELAVRTRTLDESELRATALRRENDAQTERFARAPSRRVQSWLSRVDRPQRVLQVVVADSGPGVNADDEERIFEPFFSTKAEERGAGLGLAIVAQTVEGLGGTVWVQRAREGGAAFVVLLPLVGATATQRAME